MPQTVAQQNAYVQPRYGAAAPIQPLPRERSTSIISDVSDISNPPDHSNHPSYPLSEPSSDPDHLPLQLQQPRAVSPSNDSDDLYSATSPRRGAGDLVTNNTEPPSEASWSDIGEAYRNQAIISGVPPVRG